jgi:hypothetical protein
VAEVGTSEAAKGLGAKAEPAKPASKKRGGTTKLRPEKAPMAMEPPDRAAAGPAGSSQNRESKRPLPPYLRIVK